MPKRDSAQAGCPQTRHSPANAALMPVNRTADQYPMGPTEFTDPIAFYNHFRNVVDGHEEQLKALWKRPWANYTTYITERIFPALVAGCTGIQSAIRTYWTIDCILFDDWDAHHFKHGQYAKNIYVAIEHENDWQRSIEEMNKLQILNIPLRVLITYPNCPEDRYQLIEKYTTIIKAAHDLFNEAASNRQTLVIFGYKDPKDNKIKWTAYHYTNGQLQLITHQTTGQNTPLSAPA